MKYCLMTPEGPYIERNFALIVAFAYKAGNLNNLVVLKPNTKFHRDIELDKTNVVVVDKYKSFLNYNMILARVKEEEIQESYLDYLARHNMDGTPIMSCSYVENEKEETFKVKERVDWHRHENNKREVAELNSIYFDTFNVIFNQEENLIGFLADQGIHTFKDATKIIKDYVERFGYTLLFKNIDLMELNLNTDLFNKDNGSKELSDSIGKFWIIKNEEIHYKTRTKKPLTLYAEKEDIGYFIGNQGKNIKRYISTFNAGSKYWELPYIKVLPIEQRTTNNDAKELNNKYFKLLDKIFKDYKSLQG